MFIGRKSELDRLNSLYETQSFQFPVIYGRRRIGKTTLLNEFSKNKQSIHFTAIESNSVQNLENLSKAIFGYSLNSTNTPTFKSFQDAFEYVFSIAEDYRLLFIIDEYPYLAKAEKSVASILQNLIDKYKDTSKLFLILCGSSMSFMEEHVLGYNSPLYGRRTAQFKIQPFNFFESREYFKNFTNIEIAKIYAIVGGTPQYLNQINDLNSIEDNIKSNFLNPNSYLFEEPRNLLLQEVRDPSTYNAIINAIANGCTKLSEIASKVQIETSACSIYINNLMSLGIIKKEVPFGETSSRKSIYIISDNLFRFWYRFIPSNFSIIQNGLINLAYNEVNKNFDTYMGPAFEEISKQFLWELNKSGNTPFTFTNLNRWWGNDPIRKCEADIDIMGSDGANSAIFCECKWSNEKTDYQVLEKLVLRSTLFNYQSNYFYLFSKSGFTSSCIEKAKSLNNTYLITFDDMISWYDNAQK